MKFNSTADYRFGAVHGNLSSNNWKPGEFNFKKIIQAEPAHFLSVFMGLQVSRCQNHICLEIHKKNPWNWRDSDSYSHDNYLTLFEDLEDHYVVAPQFKKILREKMFEPPLRKLRKFLKNRNKILEKYKNMEKKVVKGGNLGLSLDWRDVINSQLMEGSRISEEDLVMIQGGPKMLVELIKHLRTYENG